MTDVIEVGQPGAAASGQPGAAARFKRSGTTLRAYLDLDRAESRRRRAIRVRNSAFRRALAVADVLAVCAVLVAGAVLLGDDSLTLGLVGTAALLILVMKAAGLYDRDEYLLQKTTLDELPSLFHVATLGALLLWLVGDQIVVGDLGRRQIFGMWALLFVLLIVGRSLARYLGTRFTETERCLLIGDPHAADIVRRKLGLGGAVSGEVVARLPMAWAQSGNGNGNAREPRLPDNLYRILAEQQVHRVILAPGRVDTDALHHIVRELRAMEVSVSILPATPQVAGSAAEVDHIHGLTLLGVRFQIGRSSQLLKRAFDVVGSTLFLVLLSPLLLAIAIAIKVSSPGPILFRQRRIGRDGKRFEMLKFRSMYEGSETRREELGDLNEAEGLFKIEHDPRSTRIGDVLRRWSLDELPQLINVIRGEMSLVGPRPLVPDEDAQIEGFYRRRLDLAPGITGYWQALGSSRIPLGEMIQLDFLYVANWSLWSDARILLRTVPYVVGRRGR